MGDGKGEGAGCVADHLPRCIMVLRKPFELSPVYAASRVRSMNAGALLVEEKVERFLGTCERLSRSRNRRIIKGSETGSSCYSSSCQPSS